MQRLDVDRLEPGSVFDGKYVIEDEIGGGSFGRVYRARQRSTGQLVAVKVQRSLDADSDQVRERQRERFRRETRLCAELAHPNVVRLVDASEGDGDTLYAVFEYVPGSTLAQLLAEEGPLPPRELARLMIQVLDALAAAHRKGIVHRDLKTDNVMVSGTGALRNAHVLDFGLGGYVEARREAERRVTLSREFMGTPLYAAPEQLRGEPASPRSDVYAWGLILLECLTGQHAFEGAAGLAVRFAGDGAAEVQLPEALRDHPLGELLTRVTSPDPAKRDIEPAEIVRVLESVDWEALGARLASPARLQAPRGARRQVTILSCRMHASDQADFEARHAALRALQAICAEAALRHGGGVTSAVGDRVLLHFGFPVAHESDARRAARSALEIVARVGQRAADSRRRADAPAAVHIGIHTGPVVARDTRGGGAPRELDLAGPTAETAAHLDALASAGEILLGETTQRLLRGTLATRARGEEHPGGARRPAAIYRLEIGAPEAVDSGGAATRLVGRATELRQLRDDLDKACAGRPRCLVVAGEPGIGKSRLVRELRAHASGVRWLTCRCLEDTRDTPLHPLVELLRSFAAPLRETLARHGLDPDEYAALFGRLIGRPDDGTPTPAPVSPDREKFLLLDGLARLLLSLAREEPTVVVFEDVHWADPTTRELLGALIERMRVGDDEPKHLLLLLTSRDFSPPGASVIALERLAREEVVEMVASAPALDPLPQALLDRIVEKADGIPLFVEEVTRVLVEQRLAAATGDAAPDFDILVPAELEALLQARLDTLSERALATTQLAAALGREFSYPLLKAASGASDQELHDDLAELTRGGFVLLRRSVDGESYLFKHAMIRDAAYATMLGDARRDRHARIATLLEGAFSEVGRSRPEVLARHLQGAGESERAAGAWREAGRSAMAKGAYVEAIRHFERGLAALPDVADVEARGRLEFEITGSLGTALIATMGYAAPRVQQTFARASAICDELGEDLPLEVLYGIWSVHLVRGDAEATAALVPRFLKLAERAPGDALVQLTAHAIVGLRTLLLGEFEQAERELDQAVHILDRPGSLALLRQLPYSGAVYPIAWRMLLLLYRGYPQRALASRDHLNEVAERIGDPYGVAVAGHFSALLARDLGDVAGARELAERQIAYSREQKILLWQSSSECIRGWARAHAGDPAGVQDLAGNIALLRAIGLTTTVPTLLSFLAEAQLAAGQAGAARAAIADARTLSAGILDRYYLAELHRIEGLALRDAGDPVAARACLAQALEVASRQGAPWFALRAATELVRLDAAPGARGAAREALRSALDAIEGGVGTAPVDAARALLDLR